METKETARRRSVVVVHVPDDGPEPSDTDSDGNASSLSPREATPLRLGPTPARVQTQRTLPPADLRPSPPLSAESLHFWRTIPDAVMSIVAEYLEPDEIAGILATLDADPDRALLLPAWEQLPGMDAVLEKIPRFAEASERHTRASAALEELTRLQRSTPSQLVADDHGRRLMSDWLCAHPTDPVATSFRRAFGSKLISVALLPVLVCLVAASMLAEDGQTPGERRSMVLALLVLDMCVVLTAHARTQGTMQAAAVSARANALATRLRNVTDAAAEAAADLRNAHKHVRAALDNRDRQLRRTAN